MTGRLGSLLALSLAFAPALAEHVETLTRANFERRVNEADIIVVKFYAPWCGHCKAMAPAYEEAARRLKEHTPPIALAKVDGTQEPEIGQNHGIKGYPTLKIFRKGVASDYGGPRDADGIVSYLLKQIEDMPLSSASSEEVNSPLYIAGLCRDQTCGDDEFPLIDYNEEEKRCVCSKHPCWDDKGQVHSCLTPAFPHLYMTYHEDGRMECSCNKNPQYLSPYIAKVKCSGHKCEEEDFPLLDFDPKEKRCVCKKHPCHDQGGVKHECSDGAFPILLYREEKIADGSIKPICECRKRIVDKSAGNEL
jgi:protein disulfide-isomerase-like protein